jgi:hypothetical protein
MNMPEFMCQFGDCDETDTPIVISNKKSLERARFCCAEHAARYLLRNESLTTLDRVTSNLMSGRDTCKEK